MGVKRHIGLAIRTNDGKLFIGGSAGKLVAQMKRTQWNAPDRKMEYMAEVIDRVEMMTGCEGPRVRGLTPTAFIDYLAKAKVIEVLHQSAEVA